MDPLFSSRNDSDDTDGAADARRDLRRRDIVDDALALMRVAGTLSALEYLKSHAVDGRIIARVLLDPAKRRNGPGLAAV
ncbi:hypothetical protein [Massilia sp. 9I]|uniref:hypothetical protein n=1 Tax=Massilia sp. 9I TaxID=2653152 RepID=UPI0012F24D8D|nr:hypothetical protein [Massilia sp. 9I]VXB91022.1 conserved hypothetical protein [Massilia sp. 9I]